MMKSFVLVALVLSLSLEQNVQVLSGPRLNGNPWDNYPPFGKCCETIHNIYVIQNSDAMEADNEHGARFARDFLMNTIRMSDYYTQIEFGGLLKTTRPYAVIQKVVHQPFDGSLSFAVQAGETILDDAINAAAKILGQMYKDRTRVIFIASGLKKIQDLNVPLNFRDVRQKFEKKTGCKVEVQCFWTSDPHGNPDYQTFRAICSKMGARDIDITTA